MIKQLDGAVKDLIYLAAHIKNLKTRRMWSSMNIDCIIAKEPEQYEMIEELK